LGDDVPVTLFARQILFKRLTLKSFGNINTQTMRDPQLLSEALRITSGIIGKPHFKTNVGRIFQTPEMNRRLYMHLLAPTKPY
jgi:hypothetical protein